MSKKPANQPPHPVMQPMHGMPPPPPKGTIVIGVGPQYVQGGVVTPGMVGTKILDITGTIPNEIAAIQAILQAAVTKLSATPVQLDKEE